MHESSPSLDVLCLRPRQLDPFCVEVVASERGIRSIELRRSGASSLPRRASGPASAHLEQAAEELSAYFRGEARELAVPLDLSGQGTPFQRRVWRALRGIPYGTVTSYAGLAASVGLPGGARAVGRAVGRNPIPVIIPCHRVVGSQGRLTGFSSGLGLKVILLEIEGVPLSAGRRAADRRVFA